MSDLSGPFMGWRATSRDAPLMLAMGEPDRVKATFCGRSFTSDGFLNDIGCVEQPL